MVRRILALTSLALVAAFALGAAPASASHSWSNYHWARTANPFTLKVVDSNTADWDLNQAKARFDWSTPSGTNAQDVMNVIGEAGDSSVKARKRCVMISGKIHSCNAAYGFNGWLGLASINISGGHITQGSAKMNDSYFASGSYNDTNRQHVMCQEIGHDFGLTHQSEDGNVDLQTCMDYSSDLGNPSPNAHDYEQLETIYTHLDSSTTIGAALGTLPDAVPSWAPASQKARSVYVDKLDDGSELVTFVLWANPIHAWR